MGKTTKQARPVKSSPVTDHSRPTSKRVELAATAAWEITTLCDELLEQAAKVEFRQPHHSARIIKLLASRAHDLAETAALCLTEDEANQPFADLERTVTHG
jgi:hypothetical protein